jgi:integrase
MKRPKVPTYGHHKATGQARCYVGGKSYYLGPFGSEASRIRFGEIVAKVIGGLPIDPLAPDLTQSTDSTGGLTVNELCLSFLRHANSYYTKDGRPSAEVWCFKSAIKPLIELHGLSRVNDITPLNLKAVREAFIAKGWSRIFCNKSTNRVRHIFRWAVENGMASVVTLQSLQAVSPLKAGKCAAPDHRRREAVDDARIEAVRRHLPQEHRDLLDLLRHTGARPSELLGLSLTAIDTTGEVWVANLVDHKNAHRGLPRKLFFGPKSQLILKRRPAPANSSTARSGRFLVQSSRHARPLESSHSSPMS